MTAERRGTDTRPDGDTSPAPGDQRQIRRLWLDMLAGAADSYLRSPAFLDAMKGTVDGLIRSRRRAAGAAEETAPAGEPTPADIADLLAQLRAGQEGIDERLAAIERRLDALDKKTR